MRTMLIKGWDLFSQFFGVFSYFGPVDVPLIVMMNEPKPMDFGRISSNFKADSSFHGLGMGQPSKI